MMYIFLEELLVDALDQFKQRLLVVHRVSLDTISLRHDIDLEHPLIRILIIICLHHSKEDSLELI